MARLKKAEKELIRKCISFARESIADQSFIAFDFMEYINREKNHFELQDILLTLEERYK